MAFDVNVQDDGRLRKSPGGYEFGIQGLAYGAPVPKSITFFLDNTCIVCDQYGRVIRTAGEYGELKLAHQPPSATHEGTVVPRPQFATHAQVIAALKLDRFDWQSYEVRFIGRDQQWRTKGGLTLKQAEETQNKLIAEQYAGVVIARTIACAGWPQLPYEELKKLHSIPPTPYEELQKIPDRKLRADALRIRQEVDDALDAERGYRRRNDEDD